MTDSFQLLAEFRSDVPVLDDASVERALARVTAPRARRSRLVRRRVTVAVAFAALALAAAAIAAVKEGPWWQSGAPPVDPQAVVSIARDNMPANVKVGEARTVTTDGDAALVAVPLDQTGYCLIPALDGHAAFDAPCVYQVVHPAQGDSDIAETASHAGHWIAYGRITDPRAAEIDLGAFSLSLAQGGFFLGEIPVFEWSKLSGTANAGAILDGSGHVLRRGCVNWGASPDAPSGRFSSELWLDRPAGGCEPQLMPPVPTVDLSQATPLFDVTLTQPYSIWKSGQRITFEQAPASDGTTCVFPTGPGLPHVERDGCGGPSLGAGRADIDPGVEATLEHENGEAFYAWDVSGSTKPSANIARLTLTSPSASADVAYRDGFFFVQLPVRTPGPRVGTIPLPGGPWVLTGYDASGHEVARADLSELHRKASPH